MAEHSFGAGAGFSPTSEQVAIIDAAKENIDISIEALAGTGKTTTLKLLADSRDRLQGVYIAFNRSIVDEAKSKFPTNVTCSTAHGLAFRAVGREYVKRLNSTQRLSFKQIAEWLEVPPFRFKSSISDHLLDEWQVVRYVQKTVENFCKSIDQNIFPKHVAMPEIISTNYLLAENFSEMVLPFAKKVWNDLLLHEGIMKFSHDYYLKMWQLTKPIISASYILFDEAQDADPVMLDVVNSQTSSQLIYCGDQFQAIYEWRGAKNALAMMEVDQHLWLTQSFRFGDAIAEKANELLAMLNSPEMIKGFSNVGSHLERIENPDAILCRTNAGVISALLSELDKGRSVSIIGRTQELINFVEACQQLLLGGRTGHPELAPFLTWADVLEFVEEYPDEAQELRTMVKLVESFGVSKLLSALDQVVVEARADVVLSTAHRAKGREWNKVKLNGDFLHIDDMDTEDLRLAYVAITRAKKILDMTEWNLIKPLASQQKVTPELIVTNKVRPPINVDAEKKSEIKRGLLSRLKRLK